jgi:hypothetical protein
MRLGTVAAFACAAVLGLGVAGCGPDSAGNDAAPAAPAQSGGTSQAPKVEAPRLDPVAAVRESADKTRSAGTSRLQMVVSAIAGGQRVELTAKGVFDYAKGVGELKMTLPATTGVGGTIREIITKKALYMTGNLPGLPKGKWIKVSLDQLNVSGGSGLTSNDPAAALEMVRGASDDVTKVGEATVRGEKTTHYRGTLDLDKALANARKEARAQVRQYLEQAGTTSVPFDLYVDDQGRLRKLVEQFNVKAPGSGTADMELTLEMYDYGLKVHITEPSAGDVIEAPGAIGGTG